MWSEWRKGSRSNGAGGNCVEVAASGGSVFVRHSRHPNGALLVYTASEWSAFLHGAKKGEFDLVPR